MLCNECAFKKIYTYTIPLTFCAGDSIGDVIKGSNCHKDLAKVLARNTNLSILGLVTSVAKYCILLLPLQLYVAGWLTGK